MMTSGILSYFDLSADPGSGSTYRRTVRKGPAGKAPPTDKHFASQAAQYLALSLGVVSEPFFTAYKQGQAWGITWQWILFALLVTLAVFPAVYRAAWDPDKPLFVQLCAIFAAGLGWHTILVTGAKALHG